jgi:hypothetical protein
LYGGGDAIANVAKQSGQLLRCHTLVWYSQLPSWGPFSPGNCFSYLQELTARVSKQLIQQRPNATRHYSPHPECCGPLQRTMLRLGCGKRGLRRRRQVSSEPKYVGLHALLLTNTSCPSKPNPLTPSVPRHGR